MNDSYTNPSWAAAGNTAAATVVSSYARTAAVTLDNEENQKGVRAKASEIIRSACSVSCVVLFLSLCAMLVGVALLVLSIQSRNESDQSSKMLGPSETQAYWLELKDNLIPQDHVLLPDSAQWKALNWMALSDPLRPLSTLDDKQLASLKQRYALIALFFHWGGPGWSLKASDGWLSEPQPFAQQNSTDYSSNDHIADVESVTQTAEGLNDLTSECNWAGVECNHQNEVTGLKLHRDRTGFVLRGQVPSELSLLSRLEHLDLTGHHLKGSLPSQLGQLESSLKVLRLGTNKLSRVDAGLWGKFTSLRELSLNDNLLQGTVDFELLKNLTQLQILNLANNDELIGYDVYIRALEWPQLETLNVGFTRIGGSLPVEIYRLSNLRTLGVSNSPFFGSIPTSIGYCSNLEALAMADPMTTSQRNGITGPIPTEIGMLTNLKLLSMSDNLFDATLPTELGRLTQLQAIDFKTNVGLHGVIPTEMGNIGPQLVFLHLQATRLTGTVPSELGKLSGLVELRLHATMLSGVVPDEICALHINDLTADCKSFNKISCSCCGC